MRIALLLLLASTLFSVEDLPATKHLRYQNAGGLEYWVYQEDPNASKAQPLLIFLHGKGETTMSSLLKWGPPKHIENGKRFPGIVITPLSPNGEWWRRERLIVFVDSMAKKYNVDLKRIYLTGLSMGGFASWDLACHYPDRFAALVPICGGGNPQMVDRIKNLPTRVYHGDKDRVVVQAKSDEMVDALRKVGGIVDYTIYPGVGHASWIPAYKDEALYDWIYKQQRKTDAQIDPHAEAKFVMRNGVQLRVSPRLIDELIAAQNTLSMQWLNVSDYDATVTVTIKKHKELTIKLENAQFTIPTGQNISHNAIVDGLTQGKQDYDHIWFTWQVRYDAPGLEEQVFKQGYAFLLSPLYQLKQQSITVDGDCSEWQAAWQQVNKARSIMGMDKKSPRDDYQCTFDFQTSYDDKYFYVAVRVQDNQLSFLPKKPVWSQDGVEIRLDARPYTDNARYVDWESFLPLLVSPQHDGSLNIWKRNQLPKGTQVQAKIGDKTYSVEAAIPLSYIKKRSGDDWKRIRLNVAVNDLDDPKQRPLQLWWYADWRRAMDSRREGTFSRE